MATLVLLSTSCAPFSSPALVSQFYYFSSEQHELYACIPLKLQGQALYYRCETIGKLAIKIILAPRLFFFFLSSQCYKLAVKRMPTDTSRVKFVLSRGAMHVYERRRDISYVILVIFCHKIHVSYRVHSHATAYC